METEQIVQFFLEKEILVSEDAIDELKGRNLELFFQEIEEKTDVSGLMILDKDTIMLIESNKKIEANWEELDKARIIAEKSKDNKIYDKFMDLLKESSQYKEELVGDECSVRIVHEFQGVEKKREVKDFIAYYSNRYRQLERMFQGRQDLQGLTSITRVLQKRDKESVSIIGMVKEKRLTKNGNLIIEVEDPTGSINLIVSKNKPELFNDAKDIVPDEVIGVNGTNSDKIMFVNTLLHPDIPLTKELKKCKDEVYAIFLSDLHVGSRYFLDDDFDKFLKWINSEVGNEEQRMIAKKIKYVFIIGDLVDGVGIYPGQEEELSVSDIYRQYESCAELLKRIPKDKKLIICPGNHDAVRIAEPQLKLPKEFVEGFLEMSNVILVDNPSYINIHASDEFSGFDVLMYHGYSFDYYAANVESIRNGGGYDRADLIMKFLLQRRHMAPTHASTLFIPETVSDPLVIEKIPDFFATGHIHKSSVSHYRNITLVSGSCFQSKTPFQEKVGHKPEPARVPIVNLNTREVKILKF